jgi:hypothetical protein
MTPVLDVAIGYNNGAANSTSATQAHTTGSGSNRLMLVSVKSRQATGASATGVTYNSVALTKLGEVVNGTQIRTELWYLLAPASGTHDVVVTLNATALFSGDIVTLTGVDQVTPLGTLATGTGSSQAPSVTVTSATGDLVLDFLGYISSASVAAPGSGQTQLATSVTSNATTGFNVSSYSSDKAGAASVAMAWTISSTATNRQWAGVGVSAKAAAASAPVNTVAPVASGTASVTSVLSTTNGTWSNTPTSFAYQWQNDGTNISGATASTYTVVSGDAGHTIRCVVTATNGSGSASANSNGIAIPATPVNTVAPVITTDGTPATNETITVNTGTWTGTGITYTYQWYRGASPITGATTNSYLLAVTDEGANITARVTATNGGGAATAVSSNTITPAVDRTAVRRLVARLLQRRHRQHRPGAQYRRCPRRHVPAEHRQRPDRPDPGHRRAGRRQLLPGPLLPVDVRPRRRHRPPRPHLHAIQPHRPPGRRRDPRKPAHDRPGACVRHDRADGCDVDH